METKYLLNRKKILTALQAVFLTGFAACVFAAPAVTDPGLALRHRLDSLEVEKQVRKRQGKPIEDLEAVSAELRDSLVGLRASVPQAAPPKEAEQGLSSFGKIPYIEEILSFRPTGAFDWVIVGTGAVALLSGLVLVIGLFAGRKKKRAAVPKKQQVSRKINLAPTATQRAVPEASGSEPPPPRDSVAEFQSLVENLRKVAPASPQAAGAPPFPLREPEPRGYAPLPKVPSPLVTNELEPRKAAPTPPPPPPPAPPPPLIVNAPETPPSPISEGLSGKPLASEVLSVRTPTTPPGPAVGAFSDLVIVAAKDGLGELEISRRYQLSVDQVRLILRMERNRPS